MNFIEVQNLVTKISTLAVPELKRSPRNGKYYLEKNEGAPETVGVKEYISMCHYGGKFVPDPLPEDKYTELMSVDLQFDPSSLDKLHFAMMTFVEFIQKMGFAILEPVEFGLCDPSLKVKADPPPKSQFWWQEKIPLGVADMLLYSHQEMGVYICDLKTSGSKSAPPQKKFCSYQNASQVHFYGLLLERMSRLLRAPIKVAGYVIIGVDWGFNVMKAYKIHADPSHYLYCTGSGTKVPLVRKPHVSVNPDVKGEKDPEDFEKALVSSIKNMSVSCPGTDPEKSLPSAYSRKNRTEPSSPGEVAPGNTYMLSCLFPGTEKRMWACGKVASVRSFSSMWNVTFEFEMSYCSTGDRAPWTEMYSHGPFFPTENDNYSFIAQKENDIKAWKLVPRD